ncbi:alpha-mannosidase [Flammeovirga sp. MY04]|uniref:alpha-mannosidase n=1 Tax=Flammeovirga sp. MY04 TaxID=1191459 RepID=UPI000806347F|nr:alpha-mannosidase [Flammeovirga sp. MY04]ANQ48568.1 alpha-mannosidase [Flammeovirga sp. MY04]
MKRSIIAISLCFFATILAGQTIPNKISSETLKYIEAAAEGDHLALEGGHMALDGHVMPYPFFKSHEVLYLYRLSQLRHNVIWKADSVYYQEDWKEGNELIKAGKEGQQKVPASYMSGDRHSTHSYWLDIPKLPEKNEKERFFCLKPMEMSLVGWPETTIYINGKAKASLLRQHFYWSLDQLMTGDKVESVCLKSFGVFDKPRGYREISIVERNKEIDQLYWYLRVLVEAASILKEEDNGYTEIRQLADEVMAEIDLDISGTVLFDLQLKKYLPQLEEKFQKIVALADNQVTLYMLMHGHLDSAWRWTLAQTDDKIQRLVMNNLYLMDRYPEYKYMFTMPYHYERLKELYPELYARVLDKIEEGQWLANGATYAEPDVNLPGGESIIRNFLYGLTIFREELGMKNPVLFLPDTFGYPPFLPQVAQGFGINHLIAMRVNTPKIDHSIYRWKGIDGSEILVNALTTPAWEYPFISAVHGNRVPTPELITTYNAPDPGPRRLVGTWERFKDADATNKQLLLIGWGDGGGGGTEDQLELARLVKDLPSIPKVEWSNMYDYIQEHVKIKDNFAEYNERILPRRWIQRTFMMANGIKMQNRKAEQLLRETEALSAWASQSGYTYPKEELTTIWKELLLYHFHDIITGMAVPEVMIKTNESLKRINEQVLSLRTKAWDHLEQQIAMEHDGLLVFNSSGIPQSGVMTLGYNGEAKWKLVDENNNEVNYEVLTKGQIALNLPEIPAMSYAKLYWVNGEKPSTIKKELLASKRVLENTLVKVKFNEFGEITSYYDKELKKEVVPDGKVQNQMLAQPHEVEKGPKVILTKATFKNYKKGALSSSLELNRSYENSGIQQIISLKKGSKLLTFDTKLDWNERDRLEVDFPLSIKNDSANHGIQFGYMPVSRGKLLATDSLEIPTCVHQWADVSDNDYGFAMIDNTRYGYNLKEGGIRLVMSYGQRKHDYSELKNVGWGQDASGDLGGEHFSYAVLPHQGNLTEGKVIQTAKAFNTELLIKPLEKQKGEGMINSFLSGLPDNIVLQTIKQSEEGKDIVLRLYETNKKETNCQLKIIGQKSMDMFASTMDEGERSAIEVKENTCSLTFAPFEIKTIILSPQENNSKTVE